MENDFDISTIKNKLPNVRFIYKIPAASKLIKKYNRKMRNNPPSFKIIRMDKKKIKIHNDAFSPFLHEIFKIGLWKNFDNTTKAAFLEIMHKNNATNSLYFKSIHSELEILGHGYIKFMSHSHAFDVKRSCWLVSAFIYKECMKNKYKEEVYYIIKDWLNNTINLDDIPKRLLKFINELYNIIIDDDLYKRNIIDQFYQVPLQIKQIEDETNSTINICSRSIVDIDTFKRNITQIYRNDHLIHSNNRFHAPPFNYTHVLEIRESALMINITLLIIQHLFIRDGNFLYHHLIPLSNKCTYMLTNDDVLYCIFSKFLPIVYKFYSTMSIFQAWYLFYCHYIKETYLPMQIFIINLFSYKNCKSLNKNIQVRPRINIILKRIGIPLLWKLFIRQLKNNSSFVSNGTVLRIKTIEKGKETIIVESPLTLLYTMFYEHETYYITTKAMDTIRNLITANPKKINVDDETISQIRKSDKYNLYEAHQPFVDMLYKICEDRLFISDKIAQTILFGIVPTQLVHEAKYFNSPCNSLPKLSLHKNDTNIFETTTGWHDNNECLLFLMQMIEGVYFSIAHSNNPRQLVHSSIYDEDHPLIFFNMGVYPYIEGRMPKENEYLLYYSNNNERFSSADSVMMTSGFPVFKCRIHENLFDYVYCQPIEQIALLNEGDRRRLK